VSLAASSSSATISTSSSTSISSLVSSQAAAIKPSADVRKAHKCSDPSSGPVLGGIDLVALRQQFENTHTFPTLPLLGSKAFNATFGGYHFLFQNAVYVEVFNSSPLEYIPQLGGYCSWGLTGYDIHVSDPSGYMLAPACANSTWGFSYLSVTTTSATTQLQNFWYLMEEAKVDMELDASGTGLTLEANIAAAQKNYNTIMKENGVEYCFNTNMVKTCA
jgi:hypothetical protein